MGKYDVLRSLFQSKRLTLFDLVHAHSNLRVGVDESVENFGTLTIRKTARDHMLCGS